MIYLYKYSHKNKKWRYRLKSYVSIFYKNLLLYINGAHLSRMFIFILNVQEYVTIFTFSNSMSIISRKNSWTKHFDSLRSEIRIFELISKTSRFNNYMYYIRIVHFVFKINFRFRFHTKSIVWKNGFWILKSYLWKINRWYLTKSKILEYFFFKISFSIQKYKHKHKKIY